MADNIFEILIKYGLDSTKATEAIREMNKLKAASADATKEIATGTEKAGFKTNELKKSVHLLSAEFGPLGKIAGFILNPMVAAVGALALAFRGMGQELSSWSAGINDAMAAAARGIGDLKGAFEDLDKQRIKSNENFKTDLENLDKATQKQITRIKEEQSALEELTAAREKAELAGAKTDEERSAISQRYSAFRSSTSADFAAKEIAAREGGVAALNQQMLAEGHKASGLSGGLSPDQVAAHLTNLPALRKSLDEQIEAKQKEIKDVEPGFWMTLGMMGHGKQGAEDLRTLHQAADNSRATLKKLQETRAFYGNDFEKRLLGAQVADSNVLSLQKRIGTETEAIGDLRTSAGNRRSLNRQLSAIETGRDAEGQMLASASGGAKAILGGGAASAQEKAVIGQAAKALDLIGLPNQQILQMLSRVGDTQEKFLTALQRLDQKQAEISSRLNAHVQRP